MLYTVQYYHTNRSVVDTMCAIVLCVCINLQDRRKHDTVMTEAYHLAR